MKNYNEKMNNYYEEKTFRMETIPYYGDFKKAKTSKQINTYEYDYMNESIREAVSKFKKIDKHPRITKIQSYYFYNMASVECVLNLVQDNIHEVSYRNIGIDKPCYEVNFKIILDKTKPEVF